MSTIDRHEPGAAPRYKQYAHAPHWRSQAEEFDGVKFGFWLFLATEILLFGGIFCSYAIFRTLYPDAWAEGSSYLDWRWGGLNTVVLLLSSYSAATAVYCAQTDRQKRMQRNLLFTVICGGVFVAIKFIFEYTPKWSGYFFVLDPALAHHTQDLTGNTWLGGLFKEVAGYGGKRPGELFGYPFAKAPNLGLWWGIYYAGTGLHALHVIVGMILLTRVYLKSFKRTYGPTYYTGVEIAALYWHLVDLIWIFLFPMLYLIH